MLAILLAIVIIPPPFIVLYGLKVLGTIAEYQQNPVIELVEEMRKKHSNTNEN